MRILNDWPVGVKTGSVKTGTTILFNLEQAALLCGIKPLTLRSWVTKGAVTPALKGGRGRGCTHLFSCPQVFGLAWAAAFSQCPWGCSLRYIKKLVAAWEKLDDATLDAMTRRGGVAYSEETYAAWCRRVLEPSMGVERSATPTIHDEDDKAVVDDILARMKRVQAGIIRRKGADADRLASRVAAAPMKAERLF